MPALTIPQDIARLRRLLAVMEATGWDPAFVAEMLAQLAHQEDRYEMLRQEIRDIVDGLIDEMEAEEQ